MEKLTLEFFITVFLGTLCVGVSIALWVNRAAWMPIAGRIVSMISGDWRASLERARLQKAARERLYGYDIEDDEIGAESARASAGIGASQVVLPRQHQVALELVPDFEAVKAYLTDHTLTDDEAIELLALARRSNGDDLISANKIRDIVGGNESKVKAHVATFRRHRPKPRAPTRIDRPVNGWPT